MGNGEHRTPEARREYAAFWVQCPLQIGEHRPRSELRSRARILRRLPEPALQTEVVLALKHLKRPVLVAHDLQLERMVWTFEEGGRTDFVVPDMPATPFDPNSSQHAGTKSRGAWVVRELLAARPVTLRLRWTTYAVAAVALVYLVTLWRLLPPKAATSHS